MNFIDLINPAALADSFNINRGLADGRSANSDSLGLLSDSLGLSEQVRTMQASLDLEDALRAQGGGVNNNQFGRAASSLSNPFAAIQAFNAQNSINQANIAQRASLSNLDLANAFADVNRLRAANLDNTNNSTSSSSTRSSTTAPERVSSNGARSILNGPR